MSDITRLNAEPVAAEVIGLDELAAQACVEAAGLLWRVIMRDGVSFPVRADRRSNRISVEIAGGIVSHASVA